MSALRNRVLVGDVRDLLPTLPASSVDCVVTSPPYFRLRNYGGERQQIGLEASVDRWVDELRVVLSEVARVLKPTGSLWLNLGDTFSHHPRDGASAKSLLFGPERLALAMLEDGWIIRNKVVWAKSNPMPTSVRDRLSCTYEIVYFAVRARTYYFDLDAIRTPHRSQLNGPSHAARRRTATTTGRPDWSGPLAGTNSGLDRMKAQGLVGHPLGKNLGDVWRLPSSNYRGAHHATFPVNLIRRPLLASCPELVCSACGLPWTQARARTLGHLVVRGELRARCDCRAAWRPGLVLDPFMGSGTVAVAAEEHGRDWLGIELNSDFAALAQKRIEEARTARADASCSGDSTEMPMAA